MNGAWGPAFVGYLEISGHPFNNATFVRTHATLVLKKLKDEATTAEEAYEPDAPSVQFLETLGVAPTIENRIQLWAQVVHYLQTP